MAFPNLTLRSGGVLHSEATGTPVNGNNTFSHNIDTDFITEDWLDINVYINGPSITSVSYVSMSVDKSQITLNFVQLGADTARVEVIQNHSIPR